MTVIRGLLALSAFSSISGASSGSSALTVRQEPARIVFRWNGPVQAPMLDEFERAFQAHAADTRPIVISLHSQGGSVDHGSQVFDLIRRTQRQREAEINTVVETGSYCASMCVPIYLAGYDRTANPKARFMFHEVSFAHSALIDQRLRSLGGGFGGLDLYAVKKQLIVRATDEFYEDYFAARRVNGRWLGQMREKIRGRDIWRTAEELIQQGSGIVHAIK